MPRTNERSLLDRRILRVVRFDVGERILLERLARVEQRFYAEILREALREHAARLGFPLPTQKVCSAEGEPHPEAQRQILVYLNEVEDTLLKQCALTELTSFARVFRLALRERAERFGLIPKSK